jgi:hypothetical protein
MFKNFGESTLWNTKFAISAADPTQTTEVTLTYCCDARLPEPGGSLRKTFVMQASTVIDQGLEVGLPDGFVGSATITGEQPLAVVQTMASALPDKASFPSRRPPPAFGYRCSTRIPAGRAHLTLPLAGTPGSGFR